jgi:helicase
MTYDSTPFGETIARLYLNPVSGHIIRSGTRTAASIIAGEDSIGRFTPFSILHMISTTPDFVPFFSRAKEELELSSRLISSERERLVEDDNDLGRIKSVVTMEDWISEKTIREIEKNRRVQPGDLRLRLDLAEWLLYATKRLVKSDDSILLLSQEVADELTNAIDEIHRRIRHGCMSELLPLVALPRIGRVRAREMYDLGIGAPDDLVSANLKLQQKLSDIRGWSPQLVGNLTTDARKLLARQSRN